MGHQPLQVHVFILIDETIGKDSDLPRVIKILLNLSLGKGNWKSVMASFTR